MLIRSVYTQYKVYEVKYCVIYVVIGLSVPLTVRQQENSEAMLVNEAKILFSSCHVWDIGDPSYHRDDGQVSYKLGPANGSY